MIPVKHLFVVGALAHTLLDPFAMLPPTFREFLQGSLLGPEPVANRY